MSLSWPHFDYATESGPMPTWRSAEGQWSVSDTYALVEMGVASFMLKRTVQNDVWIRRRWLGKQ